MIILINIYCNYWINMADGLIQVYQYGIKADKMDKIDKIFGIK